MASSHHAPRASPSVRPALAASLAFLAGACGGGGSSGGGGGGGLSEIVAPEAEPNDTAGGATALLVGQPGQGSLSASGDVDWWRLELARGELLQLEVFAARFDHFTWDDPAVSGVVRVDVFHPDAQTTWRTHDLLPSATAGSPSFGHQPQDMDISFLRVPSDGTYFVRLQRAGGAGLGGGYVLRARKAAFGTAVVEVENLGVTGVNDTFATAQPVTPGALFGAQSPGDVDFVSFQVGAPSLVSFDLHAERGGMNGGAADYLDMGLRLFDSDGTTLLSCTDNVHFDDPRFEYAFSAPGTYFVEIAQARGAESGEYMLVHGAQPRGALLGESEPNGTPAQAQTLALSTWVEGAVGPGDDDFFAFTVGAGDMFEVQVLDGLNADDRTGVVAPGFLRPDGVTVLQGSGAWHGRRLTGLARESGAHFLQIAHDGTPATYRARLRVVRSGVFESEPNELTSQAPSLAAGSRIAGLLVDSGDSDLVRIDAEAGKLVVLQCYAGWARNGGSGERGAWGSSVAPMLTLLDSATTPNELAASTSEVVYCTTEGIAEYEPAASLAFISPTNATYYLRVEDAQSRFSIDHAYVLERR
jgi:hypothetical protein